MDPELIIFDCDGVLIDSEHLASQSLVDMLAEHNIPAALDEVLGRYTGLKLEDVLSSFEAHHNIRLPTDFRDKKRDRTKQLFDEQLTAIPGVKDLIASLNCKKCVASGSQMTRLQHSLGLVGLWDSFAPHIFSAEQVENGKPAPDVFLFAAAQMGEEPAACLVIEDSIPGVRAAKSAHMRVFGFTGGSHCAPGHAEILRSEGAEQVFSDMNAIATALQQL